MIVSIEFRPQDCQESHHDRDFATKQITDELSGISFSDATTDNN